MSSESPPRDDLPERELLAAILCRAVFDACNRSDRDSLSGNSLTIGHKSDARRWILYWSEEDTPRPFTFPWICEQLDLCPRSTKARIAPYVNGTEHFPVSADYLDVIRKMLSRSELGPECRLPSFEEYTTNITKFAK